MKGNQEDCESLYTYKVTTFIFPLAFQGTRVLPMSHTCYASILTPELHPQSMATTEAGWVSSYASSVLFLTLANKILKLGTIAFL